MRLTAVTMQQANTNMTASNLSIGTVAKLTGLSVHTLRAWEKRYNVVDVDRSQSGRRLYRADDVKRLRLLKRLTQVGHSIGNIASLSNEDLEGMLALEFDPAAPNTASRKKYSVCLYSEKPLAGLKLKDSLLDKVQVESSAKALGDVRNTLGRDAIDAVVYVFTSISIHHLRSIRLIKTEPRLKCFVVYSFAQRELIDELQSLGFVLLRAPVSMDNVFEKVLQNLMEGEDLPSRIEGFSEEVPAHKYSRHQLKQLSKISTAIDCECPQHIANIIRSLNMFESYSQRCASKNVEDAMLHNDIYKATAQARALMERAIDLVVQAENIQLKQNS